MRNLLLIAKREYLERIRTKAFIISTVLIPLLMMGALYIAGRGSKTAGHIAIVSADTDLALGLQEELQSSDRSEMQVDVRTPDEGTRQKLIDAVGKKEIDGYLWIETNAAKSEPAITYFSGANGDIATKQTLNSALRRVLERERLMRRGMKREEIKSLMQSPELHTETIKNGKASVSNTESGSWAALAMFLLMYIIVMFHGINVASSVVEEKSSRVFEVMLATVKPSDMMGGKLLGVGSVGFTQVAIWMVCAAALIFTPVLAAIGAGQFRLAIGATQLIFFVVYFVLGFLLYAGLAAALGSLVSSEGELRQLNMFIALPMAVNSILIAPVMTAPNSTFATVLSFIPTCTPLIMFMRISVAQVPEWQIALSMVSLVASICAVIWIAARIYRVGVLMYGKRPTLPEILRWVRYS